MIVLVSLREHVSRARLEYSPFIEPFSLHRLFLFYSRTSSMNNETDQFHTRDICENVPGGTITYYYVALDLYVRVTDEDTLVCE